LNDNAVPPILSEPGSAVAEGVHPIWIRTPVPRSMQARPKAIIAGFG
jgi:hypothetical protein